MGPRTPDPFRRLLAYEQIHQHSVKISVQEPWEPGPQPSHHYGARRRARVIKQFQPLPRWKRLENRNLRPLRRFVCVTREDPHMRRV